jgi:uncharacterized protein (DUF427 family)
MTYPLFDGRSASLARRSVVARQASLRRKKARDPDVGHVMSRPVRQPSAGHPITVTSTGQHVTVRVNGEIVADTDAALTLQEATLPAVQYIPIADVKQEMLRRTDTATYCPFKGDASYYSVVTSDGDTIDDVIWTYAAPYPAVADIAGHVAFYPDRAEITVAG